MIGRFLITSVGLVGVLACSQTPSSPQPSDRGTPISLPDGLPLSALMTCVEAAGAPVISAHRAGPSVGLPENAIETMAALQDLGLVLFEVDVRETRDGALVLMHDETLDRTTTCAGLLGERSLSDLAPCRLRDNDGNETSFAIPTLTDALEWAEGRALLQLDIKRRVPFESVIAAIDEADAASRVIVITYSLGAARRIASLSDEVMISVTIEQEDDLAALISAGIDSERVLAWTGTEAPQAGLNAALDRANVEVIFGTLGRPDRSIDGAIARSGDEARYAQIMADGVDILATDRPREAAAALNSAQTSAAAARTCLNQAG